MIKNKNGDLVEAIIIIILATLVMIALLFLIFNPYISNWIRNLPGYKYNDTDILITNFSQDQLANMGCSRVIARVGALEGSWGSREQFFYIEGKKSDLYLTEANKIMLDISGMDLEIGRIGTDNRILIYGPYLDEKSQEFLQYKEKGLPRIEVMRLLDDTFKLNVGNYICKSDASIEEGKQCNQECILFDGNCKNSCIKGEISYGQLDCKSGELCCVTETLDKIQGNGIMINKFGTKEQDFLRENKISSVYGKEGLIVINLGAESSTSFCYVIRTNENVLKKSFDDITKDNYDNIGTMPVSWIMKANEKTLELRIWDPKNKTKKAGKRLAVEGTQLPENYEQGEAINDNELKTKAENAGVGSVFYVLGLRFDWSKKGGYTYSYADYKIKITKEGVAEIYVYGVYPAKSNEWHLLDCYGGWGSSIYIKNLKQSLAETLTASCGWS